MSHKRQNKKKGVALEALELQCLGLVCLESVRGMSEACQKHNGGRGVSRKFCNSRACKGFKRDSHNFGHNSAKKMPHQNHSFFVFDDGSKICVSSVEKVFTSDRQLR